MSPIRFPRAENIATDIPTAGPNPSRISPGRSRTSPTSPRTNAWRNAIGPPSSRTTRSPSAILPSVRPRVSVSIATG